MNVDQVIIDTRGRADVLVVCSDLKYRLRCEKVGAQVLSRREVGP